MLRKTKGSLGHSVAISQKAYLEGVLDIFTPGFVKLLSALHDKFETKRQILLLERKYCQNHYNKGSLPQYLDKNSEALTTDWQVAAIPKDLMRRRVEITGPVNDPKMVINMLSRNKEGDRADTAMLDFEDSMKPIWTNVISGYRNVMTAVAGTLTHQSPGKTYKLNPKDMAGIMVRVRGLHLNESNIEIGGVPVSAGLLDLATCVYHTSKKLLAQKKTPKFYIPKCEHYLEARWWNKLFLNLERFMDLPKGTIKCTFLIETLPAAFQIEEILFELQDHIVGLNVGRWDKIFSDIKTLKHHAELVERLDFPLRHLRHLQILLY